MRRSWCSWILARRAYGTAKHEWESSEMPTYEYGWSKKKQKTSIYGWGLSAAGELGYQYDKNTNQMRARSMFPLRLVDVDKHQVSDMACGRGFSVFVSRTNRRAFGCGLNTNCQLGANHHRPNPEWITKPTRLPLEFTGARTKPTLVACGRDHTLVATDKPEVFSLGSNAHGQCGRPVIEDEEYGRSGAIHRIIDFDGRVVQMACGFDHSLLLTDKGVVYAFGLGADGQLGNGSYLPNSKPTPVRGDIEGERIIQISTSADCVLAISDKGDVFGWGNNEYQQLQTATTDIQLCVARRLNLGIGKVRYVAAGGSACAAVSESGQLYVWGYGIVGQGPEVNVRSKPSLLPPPLFGANEFQPDVQVRSVFAGLMHFAAVNSRGDLFMWGVNRHGLLGFGHENDQYFPLKVSLSGEVIKVSCGPDHTLALSKSL